MAGTIVADTLSDGAGNTTAMDNAIYGSAKAWVQWSSGTINASYNVSSITTNGAGDYTINFTNAFADNKYAFVGASGISSSFSVIGTGGYTPSASSIRMLNQNLSGSNTAPLFASVAFFR